MAVRGRKPVPTELKVLEAHDAANGSREAIDKLLGDGQRWGKVIDGGV